MTRVFLGLDLPADLKEQIEQFKEQKRLADLPIKLVEPANSHINIKFFDDLTEEQIEDIRQLMIQATKKFKTFPVEIENGLVFPNINSPRVVGLKVVSKNLEGLATKLFNEFTQFNFIEPENRPYRPHITLGRIKTELTKEEKDVISRLEFTAEFTADKISLFKSILTAEGPVYKIITDFPLS